MATLHRARVVAIGSEADMIRILHTMLSNSDWQEDAEEDDRPPQTLPELLELVRIRSEVEGGSGCGFHYGMLTQRIYGQAHPETCRMTVRREECGLWTAAFSYDSDEPFQVEDWLRLHMSCGRVPMLALRASWDFALAKGMLIITGGRVQESWDRMDECWMYLIPQYECGYPPEEAVRRLKKLESTLENEDSAVTIEELLQGCMENLQELADMNADPAATAEEIARCREEKDYQGLFAAICGVAEYTLWEADHNAYWLANLEAVLSQWQQA